MNTRLIPLLLFFALIPPVYAQGTQESPETPPAPITAKTLPQFAFPVDCTLDQDCWIVNYVDTDPAADSAKDFTCAGKTYEGNQGTDFAVRSRAEMEKGVNVLAARAGKVLRLRDGEDDLPKTDAEYAAIREKKRECGNGVILDHGQGLLSYYCHLKQGSIRVEQGSEVRAGDPIAQIGQSGDSEFPHLHLTIVWEGGYIDPFTGYTNEDGCGLFKDNLWAQNIAYSPYSVFDGGFAAAVPDFNAIKNVEGKPAAINAETAGALVYWAGFYHAREGDKITLTVTDPSGKPFARREETLENDRKEASFFYTGRKLNGRALEKGTYAGTLIYEKKGFPPQSFNHSIAVE